MKAMPNESIDLIVTDPPYLISYNTNYRKNKDHKFTKEIANDNDPTVISKYIERML